MLSCYLFDANLGQRGSNSVKNLIDEIGRINLLLIHNLGITSFAGDQVEICKAFAFEIPKGRAPAYTSKAKSKTPKRGRPAKLNTEIQEI